MQSSSHRGRTVPGSCLSAWRSTFSTACVSLVLPDGCRPGSLPAGTACDETWPAWGEGPSPLPEMRSQGTDSKLWGLIPITCPSFWDSQCDGFHRSPSSQNRRLLLSALDGHGIYELFHLVRQPLAPSLLVLLQCPNELRNKDKGGEDFRTQQRRRRFSNPSISLSILPSRT